jgi:hypothetical protein
MRIKNWHKFQHFKDRRPPWIKLYRDILDDVEWHELDAQSAKALIAFWLIASEHDGNLPEVKALAFRLRTSETVIKKHVSNLSHWLEQSDIDVISPCHQRETPETETERETETEQDGFDSFWQAYPSTPRKAAKEKCRKLWARQTLINQKDVIMAGLEFWKASKDWTKNDGQFICGPHVWLNERRWEIAGTVKPSSDPYANCDPFGLMPSIEHERKKREVAQ